MNDTPRSASTPVCDHLHAYSLTWCCCHEREEGCLADSFELRLAHSSSILRRIVKSQRYSRLKNGRRKPCENSSIILHLQTKFKKGIRKLNPKDEVTESKRSQTEILGRIQKFIVGEAGKLQQGEPRFQEKIKSFDKHNEVENMVQEVMSELIRNYKIVREAAHFASQLERENVELLSHTDWDGEAIQSYETRMAGVRREGSVLQDEINKLSTQLAECQNERHQLLEERGASREKHEEALGRLEQENRSYSQGEQNLLNRHSSEVQNLINEHENNMRDRRRDYEMDVSSIRSKLARVDSELANESRRREREKDELRRGFELEKETMKAEHDKFIEQTIEKHHKDHWGWTRKEASLKLEHESKQRKWSQLG